MATPDPARQPPNDTPTQDTSAQMAEQRQKQAQFRKLLYNSAVAICIACPLIALMPPRKMDLYTFGLGIAFCTSAGYALEEKTGRGLLWHVSSRLPLVPRKERERLARERKEEDEAARLRDEEGRRETARAWREDWMEKRKRKEREAAEDGKGYGSLILEHVREAFGKKGSEEHEDDNYDDDDKD